MWTLIGPEGQKFRADSALKCAGLASKLTPEQRSANLLEAIQDMTVYDVERIDWLEKYRDGYANIDRITSVNGKFNGFASLREAIDAEIK